MVSQSDRRDQRRRPIASKPVDATCALSSWRKRHVYLALGLFLGVVVSLTADPRPVQLQLSQSTLVEGDSFDLTLSLARPDDTLPQIATPELGSNLATQAPTETSFDGAAGTNRRITIRWHLRALGAGFTMVPAFSLVFADTTCVTDPFPIGVALKNRPDIIPPDVRWTLPDGRIFVGQPVPVSLELHYARNLLLPRLVDRPVATGAIIEDRDGVDVLSTERFGSKDLFRVPVASFMLTPTQTGTFDLPAVRLQFDGFERVAPPARGLSLALPEGATAGIPIGQFFVTLGTELERPVVGQPFAVVVRLEGNGNLTRLRMPEISAPGLELSKPTERLRAVAASSGFRGVREAIYQAVARQAGRQIISLGPFQQFEPASGQITVGGQESAEVQVQASGDLGDWRSNLVPLTPKLDSLPRSLNELVDWPLIVFCCLGPLTVVVWPLGRGRWRLFARIGAIASLVVAAGFVALQWGGVLERTRSLENQFTQLKADAQAARWQLAFEEASALAEHDPSNGQVWYLVSRAALGLQKDVVALAALDYANRLVPNQGWLETALRDLRQALGQPIAAGAPLSVSAAPTFVAASVVLVLAILGLRFSRRRLTLWPLVGAFLAFVGLAGVGLGMYALADNQNTVAFVREAVVVRKIPEANSRPWVTLARATQVLPDMRYGDFVQIETGAGIRGWVRATDLYFRPYAEPWRLWKD